MTNLDPATAPAVGARIGDGLHTIPGVEALHAREIPGTRAGVEHIAIGSSGVYVISTSPDHGPVVRRDSRLFVGNHDRSDLLAAMRVPVDAVAAALGDLHLPISRALCFVGGDWLATTPPFMLKGVWVGTAKPLYALVAQPGRVHQREIETAARLLEQQLPAIA